MKEDNFQGNELGLVFCYNKSKQTTTCWNNNTWVTGKVTYIHIGMSVGLYILIYTRFHISLRVLDLKVSHMRTLTSKACSLIKSKVVVPDRPKGLGQIILC